MSCCAKPTRIRSGWPGQGLAKRIWSGTKLVCRNHLTRFLAERNRPRYQSPTFRLGSVLPQTSRKIYGLQARPCIIQPGNVTGWGSEGFKTGFIKEKPNRRRQMAENVEHVQLLPSVNPTSLFYHYLCKRSPVNMPDPIRKRFGYGQLWPLRPACSQNRVGTSMPGSTSSIRFRSVFPKKSWIILYCDKTDPDPIWMAWPGFGQTYLVWKQAGVQESLGPVSARIPLTG